MAIELTQVTSEPWSSDEEEINEEEYNESEAFLLDRNTPNSDGRDAPTQIESSWKRSLLLVAFAGVMGLVAVVFLFKIRYQGGNALIKDPIVETPYSDYPKPIQDRKPLPTKTLAPVHDRNPLPTKMLAPLSPTRMNASIDYHLSPIQELQIQNYKNHDALMLHIHASRNAGETMCAWAKLNGPVPSIRCYDFHDGDPGIPSILHNSTLNRPWSHNETTHHVKELRKHFHMVQWTNVAHWPRSVNETAWENPNLLSTIVMRHPIERLISYALHFNRVVVNNTGWWSFVKYDDRANNGMLGNILGFGAGQGEGTPELYVEMAKTYLSRFTIIIDQDCLDESLVTLSELLDVTYDESIPRRKPTRHQSPRSIFQNDDDMYEYLVRQNRRDLELYTWAKARSVVRCNPSSPIVETASENEAVAARLATYQNDLIQSIDYKVPESNQSLKDLQIRNYLDGNALMLHSHITHHGGTSLCNWAKENGATPAFACVYGDNWPKGLPNARDKTPWTFHETNEYVPLLRKHFHLVSWEYTITNPLRSFHATNWLHPNLVSVIVMRDPLDRLQSEQEAPRGTNVSEIDWINYANGYHTNNYALRTLTNKEGCVKAADTGDDCLWLAKRLLRQFTVVIDQACFDESMEALSKMLNLTYNKRDPVWHSHPPARERIGYDDVYDFLVRRNRKDIELYEWSKSISIVNCSALPRLKDGRANGTL